MRTLWLCCVGTFHNHEEFLTGLCIPWFGFDDFCNTQIFKPNSVDASGMCAVYQKFISFVAAHRLFCHVSMVSHSTLRDNDGSPVTHRKVKKLTAGTQRTYRWGVRGFARELGAAHLIKAKKKKSRHVKAEHRCRAPKNASEEKLYKLRYQK